MPTPINDALIFLVNVIFGAYAIIVALRLILQTMGARYHNTLVQMVIRFTAPVTKPLQKILPGFKGIDLAVVIWLLLIELIKIALLLALTNRTFPDVGGWVIWALAYACIDILDVYFFAILLNAILSWFPQMRASMLTEVLELICQPVLHFFRKFLPLLGGIDFSPLLAIIVIKLVEILVFGPLANFGLYLALS